MNATADPIIRLDAISKRYPDGTVAVGRLSLDVPPGEVVMLVGPSGCGKTTTLKMINRLIEPSGGRIRLDGNDVTRADPVRLRRRIGYVILNIGLFPHRTTAENVGTVPRLLRWDRGRIADRVRELLELVGLEPDVFAGRYPSQLSGGQRQWVGVARSPVGGGAGSGRGATRLGVRAHVATGTGSWPTGCAGWRRGCRFPAR